MLIIEAAAKLKKKFLNQSLYRKEDVSQIEKYSDLPEL